MDDVPTFIIKGDARTFVMGDVPAFVIKGGVPLETRVSLLSHKRARLEYKLNESR
jgi:hypothetical protein